MIYNNSFTKSFRDSTIGHSDNREIILTEEYDQGYSIITIDILAKRIQNTEGVVFNKSRSKYHGDFIRCKDKFIIREVARYIASRDLEHIKESFPLYRFNPLSRALVDHLESLKEIIGFKSVRVHEDCWFFSSSDDIPIIEIYLNKFIENYRIEIESDEFKKKNSNSARILKNQAKSISDHIDNVFELNPSITSTLFHLGYKIDPLCDKLFTEKEMYALRERIKSDFESFMKNWRANSDFQNAVGYIWKLDYSSRLGFRYRVFIFFAASTELSLTKSVKKLKDRWLLITDGNGSFMDFNDPDIDLRSRGIGIINSDEKCHRESLTNAACTLIGINYFSNPKDITGGHLFGKGLK
jgi:hypothetical protein